MNFTVDHKHRSELGPVVRAWVCMYMLYTIKIAPSELQSVIMDTMLLVIKLNLVYRRTEIIVNCKYFLSLQLIETQT